MTSHLSERAFSNRKSPAMTLANRKTRPWAKKRTRSVTRRSAPIAGAGARAYRSASATDNMPSGAARRQAGRPVAQNAARVMAPARGRASLIEPGGEILDRRALGDQIVRHFVGIGLAQREAADHDLLVGDFQLATDHVLVAAEGGLRAGMQTFFS